MEVFIKYFCLGLIVGSLLIISYEIRKMNNTNNLVLFSIQQNTEELKKVNLGFEAINEPLGKAVNMEYKK